MKLHPYVMFNGQCEQAIEFYKDIFDAQVPVLMRYGEAPPEVLTTPEDHKQKIMHATIAFGGVSFQLCDNMQPNYKRGNSNHLYITMDSEHEAAMVFESLAEGGTIGMPFDETFWGSKFGMCTDKFDVQWMVSAEKESA
ncbi:VOC family protein [Sungkyunkwania multivorans]|uniref:VOC family protein n=1 Tax=Sungkyunkwania multivorans TaxID=1173618 RepID=A0ABW3CZW9_9FLAO